jgi:hypothetical protein
MPALKSASDTPPAPPDVDPATPGIGAFCPCPAPGGVILGVAAIDL